MIDSQDIKATPWDEAVFGVPTWELTAYTASTLTKYAQLKGHQTLKVDPLIDKQLLYSQGFYYCDTLIEPRCDAAKLRTTLHSAATVSKDAATSQLVEICHGAFTHDRFHRDFNLSKSAADVRYDNWLEQLISANQVYSLFWDGKLAGFIAHQGSMLTLHALAESYRGKGLAKYWWSAVCNDLVRVGFGDIRSSISVSNTAVLNLYASLGFSFNGPKDVYHRFVA